MLSTTAELKPLSDETIESLLSVTKDSIDAMRLAADLYATEAYLAERAASDEAGAAPPKPPRPQSKFMRSIADDIKVKLLAMSFMLDADELARLGALRATIAKRLDESDSSLTESLCLLFAMHPGDAALWIRAHLDEIETRFAS